VGVPLPSRRVDVGGEIAVLLDVSSSVDDEMFAQFCEELQLIAAEFDITSHVIKFTHRVRDVQVVEAGDEIDRTRFYGGTNTRAAFEYIDEQDLNVDAIIVFSDCEDYYDQIPEPSCPTLIAACIQHEHWLENIEKQADWAQVVQISR
jgi:predicted metal-dependent peptidase